jgi:hypothetical protein
LIDQRKKTAIGPRAPLPESRLIRPRNAAMLRRMKPSFALVISIAVCGGAGGCGGSSTMAADDMPAPTDGGGSGATGEPAALAGITMFHNQVRAMVDTTGIASGALADLTWDDSLAATARAWVAQCIDKDGDGLLDHNDGRSTGHAFYVGENIFASTGTASAHDAVFSWGDERADYTYASNTCAANKMCGHYTQVVWRTTQKVGCAIGNCKNLTFSSTIVCDYGPGGNVNNQKPY